MSGTLGDAYIVILKLYNSYKNQKILIKRISRWPNQDIFISKLCKIFPNIYYKKPCIKINRISDTTNIIEKLNLKYVNTSWNGSHFKNSEKDFKKLEAEPYPKIKINNKIIKKKKIISIQVNTGKIGGNCKIFSSIWLYELLNLFKSDEYEIILLGTIIDKSDFLYKNFHKRKNIKFLINKTSFNKWLKIIKSSDFFISNEGFPAFFSMSQKIKTVCFYTDKKILTRIHPKWKKNNLIKSVNWNNIYSSIKVIFARYLYRRYPLIYPIDPKIIYNYINKKI